MNNNKLNTGLKDMYENTISLGDNIKYKNNISKIELIENRFGARFGFKHLGEVLFLGVVHTKLEVVNN